MRINEHKLFLMVVAFLLGILLITFKEPLFMFFGLVTMTLVIIWTIDEIINLGKMKFEIVENILLMSGFIIVLFLWLRILGVI